jgi:hypothetical protein
MNHETSIYLPQQQLRGLACLPAGIIQTALVNFSVITRQFNMTDKKESRIKKKSDLTIENLELIFKAYFQDEKLKVKEVKDEVLASSSGVNNQFNSNVTYVTIQFEFDLNPIRIFVKTPIETGFNKYMGRLTKPFMRETFWYTEALPALKVKYPEIEHLSPIAYHANCAQSRDYRLLFLHQNNTNLIYLIFSYNFQSKVDH